MAEKTGKVGRASGREAELESQLWQSLAAADEREARLEGQLRAALEREAALQARLAAASPQPADDRSRRAAALQAQLDEAGQREAALAEQLAAANQRLGEQARQLEQAAEREAALAAEIEHLQSLPHLALTAHVGQDNNGDILMAGKNAIKVYPGELRTCPFCEGVGRLWRMEDGERLFFLCQNCRGLGQVRL